MLLPPGVMREFWRSSDGDFTTVVHVENDSKRIGHTHKPVAIVAINTSAAVISKNCMIWINCRRPGS